MIDPPTTLDAVPHVQGLPPAPPRTQLDLDDYLTAAADASSRTRAIIITLIVASVLSLTGLFNSLQTGWMHSRMKEMGNPWSQYMRSKLGDPPDPRRFTDSVAYEWQLQLYKRRLEALNVAVETAYVEGSLIIRVPFFGFTFDVNDLALLSSIGFLIILSCYRFFLAREIDNLRLAFTEALMNYRPELTSFYNLLAMRQVFTIPTSKYITRSHFLKYAPKAITWLPSMLIIAIIAHDWFTRSIGRELKLDRFIAEETFSLISLIFIINMSRIITIRLRLMDMIWDVVHDLIAAPTADAETAIMERWNQAFTKRR
jgi:hypothetical protein